MHTYICTYIRIRASIHVQMDVLASVSYSNNVLVYVQTYVHMYYMHDMYNITCAYMYF